MGVRLPRKIYIPKAWTVTKLILAAIVLTAFAWMPFIASFLPNDVSYAQSTQALHLKPGENHVGNVEIIIDKAGIVQQVEKSKPRITKRTRGFKNLRTFLSAGTPFFSLLFFCIFFNWCDKQLKTRYLLILKRYAWGLFLFVSIWFTYFMLTVKSCSIQGLVFYIGVYTAATITFVVGCCCFRYYHRTFKYKHLRTSALMNFLFDIQYEYPGGMQKCMKEIALDRKIREDEAKVRSLKSLGELGRKIEPKLMARRPRPAKFIAIGILLSIFALLPMSYQFASRHVDYSFKTQSIPLKPGLNTIGDLSLTLSPEGELLYATLTKRQIIHKVFGFKNLRTFLQNITPFLSSLSLCVFSFWYEQQQKNPCVQGLKRYAFWVFFLVSLWSSSWALIPMRIPVPQRLYCVGICIVTGVSLSILSRLYTLYAHKLNPVCVCIALLLSYVFGVSKRHYPRMASKAMGRAVDYQETCADIEAFHKRTSEEVEKVKAFVLLSDKLKREYEDFKRFSIDP